MARTIVEATEVASAAGTRGAAVARPAERAPSNPARRVRIDLLDGLAPLRGEADLLHQHLKDCLAELFEGLT